jgi:hypothetical protein
MHEGRSHIEGMRAIVSMLVLLATLPGRAPVDCPMAGERPARTTEAQAYGPTDAHSHGVDNGVGTDGHENRHAGNRCPPSMSCTSGLAALPVATALGASPEHAQDRLRFVPLSRSADLEHTTPPPRSMA